ncbi:MAG: hypothetical protein HYY43_00175 [Deltaproteobacteria bacterium]|nr:hypothetical protein [Deltaproteobacteria bacterium]
MRIDIISKAIGFAAAFIFFFTANVRAEIEFSGYVDNDFPDEYCFYDGYDVDVGIPDSYPIAFSGFDISKLCLQYDAQTDVLYVGVGTRLNPDDGEATVFGDADGDFDPGNVSAAVAAAVSGFMDSPDIGMGEYFAFLMDFDNNWPATPNFIAGVTFTKDISEFAVANVAEPMQPLALAFTDGYYGDPIESAEGSAVAFNPDGENPSLEFSIVNLSAIAGFDASKIGDPDYVIGVFFATGSLADGGIGEDSFLDTNNLIYLSMANITENSGVEDNSEEDADIDTDTDADTDADTDTDINADAGTGSGTGSEENSSTNTNNPDGSDSSDSTDGANSDNSTGSNSSGGWGCSLIR